MEMKQRRKCGTLESKTTISPRPNSKSQVEESKDLYCALTEEKMYSEPRGKHYLWNQALRL